jgi:hypothetical protein
MPYPHKDASMVNENGMFYLFRYIIEKSSYASLLFKIPHFALSRDLKDLLPLIIEAELPSNLPKGSFVYLQNVLTDLVLGINRIDLLKEFCLIIIKKGYQPGFITLNPILLAEVIKLFPIEIQEKIIFFFNINKTGFNVFPSKEIVQQYIEKNHPYKKMGMSILSSGGDSGIQDSLNYVKELPLDYVVYGSSKLNHIKSNFHVLKAVK